MVQDVGIYNADPACPMCNGFATQSLSCSGASATGSVLQQGSSRVSQRDRELSQRLSARQSLLPYISSSSSTTVDGWSHTRLLNIIYTVMCTNHIMYRHNAGD